MTRPRPLRMAGLVLAAGASRRLGQPKQLLPYRGTTLLDVTLARVRQVELDQRLVAIGGAGPDVIEQVDVTGFDVIENVHYTTGCSSSIVAALDAVRPEVDGFLLFLGDQPEIDQSAIDGLMDVATPETMALCRYNDGLGHPFWFGRALFDDLATMHGDKAVWKVMESGAWPVTEVPIDATIPLDVDTWADYERLLADQPA